ncbi:MAG: hypothetical protein K6A65_09610 [Succinivibrionaceae bacterium]|nr:hypothetical protein [Succinivibrionaceae bacterium]
MGKGRKRKVGAAEPPRQRNFVQEHVMQCTAPQVFTDRKRRARAGYEKHRARLLRADGPWAGWGTLFGERRTLPRDLPNL